MSIASSIKNITRSFSIDKNISVFFLEIALASLFIAILAQIEIPLFFTPVPVTGQTFGVMLAGIFLGRKKAVASLLLYLTEGCVGLPVFAGGSFGMASLLGPSGGYLFGFVLQAYLIGWGSDLARKGNKLSLVLCLPFAILLQLGMGAAWLSFFVGTSSALALGFYPFLIGEFLKCSLLLAYAKSQGFFSCKAS